ncbi:MAG: ACT domain-containing protein [Ruminococcus sp.]|nr:ACT domain-containing protein [Ruminococcus sp.]
MDKRRQYIVVDTAVLPEIFWKVLEVKRIVAEKSETSFSSACKCMGISRSAFYKYRDCVFAYDDKMTQQIVNFTITLRDQAGVLSNVLTTLYSMHANILTVNQSIPVDGVALVSLSLKMNEDAVNPIEITRVITDLHGVVEVRLLSGE